MGNCSSASDTASHVILLATGDKKGAGAVDVDVYLTFTDEHGNSLPEIKITNFWKNDFRKGKEQKFMLQLDGLKKISEIRIRRDGSGKGDAWFVEKLTICNGSISSIFPIHRWMLAEMDLSFVEYDSMLPQHSKHKEQREKELSLKRNEYILQETVVGAPPQSRGLPDSEQFSVSYEMENVGNYIEAKASATLIDLTTKEFKSLDDFDDVYKGVFKEPKGKSRWRSDEAFGYQRLCGVNAVTLRLVQEIPNHFAVTANLVEGHLEGKTLRDCLKKKKLYLIDLRLMADIECANNAKLPGPTALFYVRDSGILVPIAIQLMPQPGDGNPVFTPSDPEFTWIAAKMWFNLADASFHQTSTHLVATHLMLDGVAVCTNRQLSPSHPAFRLLAPHILNIIAINQSANETLLNPGGWVDKVMLIGRSGFLNVVTEVWKDYDILEKGNLLKNLKLRGVDDESALPNYHYRDDATLLWNSMYAYVSTVVTSTYKNAELIAGDNELQSWLSELKSDGNFKGLPDSFTTTDQITELLTVFMFASSVHHAAVNFEQYDQYAFPPFYPAWLNGTWPTSKEALSEDDIIKTLPNKDMTLDTMMMTYILSDRGTNPLGDYEIEYAYDKVTQQALKRFRAEVKGISATIEARNSKRLVPYPYLNPKEIPNSVSI